MANTGAVLPWGLHPLMPWVLTELTNRSNEVGMNPVDLSSPIPYSGPRTPWLRFFSNGVPVDPKTGEPTNTGRSFEGFCMYGVNGFNDSYGFNSDNNQILGYDANGKPHTIPSDTTTSFPHRPPPSVESVEISLYGGQNSSFSGLCRSAKVNWKCYSLDQLNYLTPYFLAPKVTAVVEWGWNNYNQSSLMDLAPHQGMLDTLLSGSGILNRISGSNGNYDATLGFIKDYGFSMNALGGFDCHTEFVNANWLVEGQEYKDTTITLNPSASNASDVKTSATGKNFLEMIRQDIDKFASPQNQTQIYKEWKINPIGRTFSTDPSDVTNDQSIGSTERKNWLRMDLIQDIFNKYFSLDFLDIYGKRVSQGNVLDISQTVICGHPAIKSVVVDVLIPNQFSPRFTTKTSENNSGNSNNENTYLSNASYPEISSYNKLFESSGILSTILSKGLTSAYDDLKSVINPTGRSFPIYTTGTDQSNKYSSPGMWGYLSDIYVSTTLIKELVDKNDTSYRLVKDLLDHINEAFCGVVQLKLIPNQYSSQLTIIDENYNPNSSVVAAATLPRFIPGSVNSAFMTNVNFTVKLSQNMANQLVAQSSSRKIDGKQQLQNGVQKANRFVGNDRLYDVGTLPPVPASTNSSDDTKTEVSTRDFPGKFIYYQIGGGKKYILVEPDKSFLQAILASDTSGKASYLNSPIMPGTKFEMEMLGIGGFTYLGQFTLDYVPDQYTYKNCVWQICDIKQTIKNGSWTTSVTADYRTLGYATPAPT